MKLKIAKIITVAALILILLYGGDIIFSVYFGKTLLPLDIKARGIFIGTPAAVLPIVAFFLSRKLKSRLVGLLILMTGILMMSGALAAAQLIDQTISNLESFAKNIASFLPVVGLGMFIVILGISKLNDSWSND